MTDSINLLTGKRGPLWARRYDAEPVVDDEGCADRMGYTANNPRAAGLVDDAHDWPGLNLTFGCSERSELTFTYLDRTAWHRARRPADLRPFLKQTTLTLSPIPACEGMPPEFYRQSLQTWMQHSHDKTVAKNRDAATKRNPTAPQAREDRPVLGLAAIVQTPFEARPRAPSLRRRPYAHGRPDRVRAHIHATLLIVHDYDDRSQRYREGDFSVEFPEGTYRPPLMRAA